MGGERRKFFVCGNWKMNGDKASIDGIVSFLNSAPLDPEAEVIVAVPAVYLDYVRGRLPQGVSVAAQGPNSLEKCFSLSFGFVASLHVLMTHFSVFSVSGIVSSRNSS